MGSKCECNCHGMTGTLGFYGYCFSSHHRNAGLETKQEDFHFKDFIIV